MCKLGHDGLKEKTEELPQSRSGRHRCKNNTWSQFWQPSQVFGDLHQTSPLEWGPTPTPTPRGLQREEQTSHPHAFGTIHGLFTTQINGIRRSQTAQPSGHIAHHSVHKQNKTYFTYHSTENKLHVITIKCEMVVKTCQVIFCLVLS